MCAALNLAIGMSAGAAEPEVRLKIATEASAGMLSVTPLVESASEQSLRYEVLARKEGPSGRTENRQSGTVQVRCCEPASASTFKWNVGPGDRYTVTVKLFAAGKLVAESSIRHPE